MRVVVADTGPLNHLVLLGESDILPKLFEAVFAPEAVRTELRHRDAPPTVRAWAERPPAWLLLIAPRSRLRTRKGLPSPERSGFSTWRPAVD